MTTEQDKAYIAWFNDPAIPGGVCNREIFCAGWEAATRGFTDPEVTARSLESYHAGMRANFMALAVQCFRDKEDAHAEFFRNLADERHILWAK